MHPDVDWPNMIEGSREHGHAAVRAYWGSSSRRPTRAWSRSGSPPLGDDQVWSTSTRSCVTAGKVMADGMVQHVYVLRDGLIERMDVREG